MKKFLREICTCIGNVCIGNDDLGFELDVSLCYLPRAVT